MTNTAVFQILSGYNSLHSTLPNKPFWRAREKFYDRFKIFQSLFFFKSVSKRYDKEKKICHLRNLNHQEVSWEPFQDYWNEANALLPPT